MSAKNKRKRVLLIGLAGCVLLAGAMFAAVASNDDIRWRAEVVAAKAAGRIPGIDWSQLLRMLRPGSGYFLQDLATNPNPFAAIRNPFASEADKETGQQLFVDRCSICHGANATGTDNAPNLIASRFKMGDSDWALYQSVSGGVEGLTMPPLALTEREAWQLVAFVRDLRENSSALRQSASTADRFPEKFAVSSERLLASDTEPQNWLTYSGSYNSWRFSSLNEINVENAPDLKLAWSLQLDTDEQVKGTPVVVDGVMYMSEPPSSVVAVDAATGELIWRYPRPIPPDVPFCCGRVNRGVAVLGDTVFINTLDAYLEALDARTGALRWSVRVAEYRDGFSMTSAPLALDDKIIVGVAGGEYGIRGFLDAYDAATGERLWRFHTIPAPGEPGSETWAGEAWRTGGGPTWVTGSYDPALGLVYWGVGNPAPDFDGSVRPGDNLYTDAVIALDADTGELRWHFQFTPHDEHDWDSNQIPVLVDREIDGRLRPLMLWANRNGFYYVLDRATGEFLHASPFVRQTWAEGIDAAGRPIVAADSEPTPRGTLTWPGTGATNWWSPSFSPMTDLFYVPVAEVPRVFFKGNREPDLPAAGGAELLGSTTALTGESFQVGVRALDPDTGELVWEYLNPPRTIYGYTGGTLSTAGNVLFTGDNTHFLAFDARDGRELLRINLGGVVNASPMTYSVNGRQIVVLPAGDTLFAFRR